MSSHENVKVGVDPVIFSIINDKLCVFLKRREKGPFENLLELPGGLLIKDETAEETLKRKLAEFFGEHKLYFRQFHTFTNANRDPRERIVSIGFLTLINSEFLEKQDNWFDVDKLDKLAFDHNEIVSLAREDLKTNLNSKVVREFLPEKFPLNKLQKIHEIIEEKEYDNRNFRKQMINSETVVETKEMETNVSHRPARLFVFKN